MKGPALRNRFRSSMPMRFAMALGAARFLTG